jgi:hypothetical protein
MHAYVIGLFPPPLPPPQTHCNGIYLGMLQLFVFLQVDGIK